MLLWRGQAGSPDAQYGAMEVDGHGYAPCVTSAQELSASGWNRSYEVIDGLEAARALYPDHLGLWLNPHAPGGGVGIPWLDLRRIATGLERQPAGPLRLSEPPWRSRSSTPCSRRTRTAPRRAHPAPRVGAAALGAPYLTIGLDVYDAGPASVDAVRAMMQRSVGAVPDGLPVSTVTMTDDHDPVVLWMRAQARPFYDREAHVPALPAAPAQAPAAGYGYPPPARY